jgi:glycogen synthase
MRIQFLSNFYPPYELGGMEQLNWEVATCLQARGHQVSVLTSRNGSTSDQPQEDHIIRSLFLESDIHYYHPLDFFFKRSGRERANCQELRKALDTFQPDVIFIWGMWNLSRQLAYWAEQRLPGRVAYAVASYWPMEPNVHEAYWQEPTRRPWVKALLTPARLWARHTLARERRAYVLELDQVVCVSEYVRRQLATAAALPHGARVIYNGIDPEPYLEAAQARSSSEGHPLRLIYVGGLLPHKGVHTAIEALRVLRQSGVSDELLLTLVGSGHPDYETALRKRVAKLGLKDQVTFRGHVPREQVASLLGEADVFLFTSIWDEPIARSVMEAMAAGLAVIGTPVGGQVEMLKDGVNALLFAPDSADQLADRILRLHRDPSLRRRLAKEGQKTVLERFTLKHMIDEIEVWLEGIAA